MIFRKLMDAEMHFDNMMDDALDAVFQALDDVPQKSRKQWLIQLIDTLNRHYFSEFGDE